ncbi:unnamed protein product [Vitrella brassicaformis CCMP3155]|uniref:Uncharacterized protein n=1 Tax=Vitrella brassicaformis (strain CCMP3155) TaxID=1169540 RepID=A0A0G4EKI5_VITBC|nr:unnamed protein product [Vitrella brassicaformis CCMP3155]|eukprot:CEL97631.1 unnamed protein product [Vitrella brassicaformis CCMP3155]
MPVPASAYPNLARDDPYEWSLKYGRLQMDHPEEFERWRESHWPHRVGEFIEACSRMWALADLLDEQKAREANEAAPATNEATTTTAAQAQEPPVAARAANPPTTYAPPLPHPQHHYYLPPSPPAPPKLQFQPFMATQVELTGLAGVEGEAEEGWYEDDVNGVMLWERGEGNTWWVRSARQDWWMRMVWGVYSIWWGAPERSH